MIKVELKGKQKLFNYFDALEKKFGKSSMPRIIRSEAITILNGLAKTQKKATVSKLISDGRRVGFNKAKYSGIEMYINAGRRGAKKHLAWAKIKTENGYKFVASGIWDGKQSLSDNKFNNVLREGISNSRQQEKLHKGARGLTAKFWYELAEKVAEGGDKQPEVQEFVKKAQRKDGKPISTSLFKRNEKHGYVIRGVANSVTLSNTGGQFRFDLAKQKRSLFFKRALKMGWLDDAKWCQKYCAGIQVNG